MSIQDTASRVAGALWMLGFLVVTTAAVVAVGWFIAVGYPAQQAHQRMADVERLVEARRPSCSSALSVGQDVRVG